MLHGIFLLGKCMEKKNEETIKNINENEKTKKIRRRIEETLRKKMTAEDINALAVILKVPRDIEE